MSDPEYRVFDRTRLGHARMSHRNFIANIEEVRDNPGIYELLIDTPTFVMWRWKHDKYWVIYMRDGATEFEKEA